MNIEEGIYLNAQDDMHLWDFTTNLGTNLETNYFQTMCTIGSKWWKLIQVRIKSSQETNKNYTSSATLKTRFQKW